jgi:hypothetical protein
LRERTGLRWKERVAYRVALREAIGDKPLQP